MGNSGSHIFRAYTDYQLIYTERTLYNTVPLDCDNWATYKLNAFIVKDTHLNPLQELKYSDVFHSFRSTYSELFQHIDRRKQNITYKLGIIY